MLLLALALAATPLDRVLDQLARRVEYADLPVSPDGSRAAWVEHAPGKDGPDPARSLIYLAVLGQMTKHIGACPEQKPCDEGEIAWSPDGKQLAFLSDAGKKGQQQLYVGGDVGAWSSSDGGTTWITSQEGPADVQVDSISFSNG